MALTIADIQASAADPAVKDLLRKVVRDIAAAPIPIGATLRNIATRCRVNNYQSSATPYATTVSGHVNLGSSPLQQFTVDFSTWWTDTSGEHASASTTTLTASVEYPAGVFTQLDWNGNRTTIQPGGAIFTSDLVTLPVAVPRGGFFRIHNWQYTPAGCLTSNSAATSAMFGDKAFLTGVAPPDQTMTGGEAPNESRYFAPLSINAYSSVPSILLIGDSRMAGVADNPFDSAGGTGSVARQFDGNFPYCNAGSPGDQLNFFVNTAASSTQRVAMQSRHTHVHHNYGINDLDNGRSLTQMQTDYNNFVLQKYPNIPCSWSTILPNSTSTDGFITVANQTKYAPAIRETLNTDARSQFPTAFANYKFIVDEAILVESSLNSGLWAIDPYGRGALTGDGLHANQLGCQLIANARRTPMAKFVFYP